MSLPAVFSQLAGRVSSTWLSDRVFPLVVVLGVALVMAAIVIALWRLRLRHTVLSTDLEAAAEAKGRAIRAQREVEFLYHSLVETLPQMILRKDLDGRFTFANQRFCLELGHTLEEILGKMDFDYFPRDLAEKYRRDDRWVIETGEVLDVVEEHVTPQGDKLYVQVMKTRLMSADGRPIGVQGIFWDVTDRVRADEQLREQNITLKELAHSEHEAHEALKSTQSRLVQTEKLASLGQLVAGVAHEINNPLSFVSNNVAVLERDLKDLLGLIELYRQGEGDFATARPELATRIVQLGERIDLEYTVSNLPKLLERTREGLRRIERIVKELRLFARVDEGDWNEVDLNPGIESSINIIKGYARKKGVRIVMDLGALPSIRCRAARIHQVVVNLLTNAIDACSEEGGLVTVKTDTEPEAMGVRIEVRDNGCGIPAAISERIFDPFFTTKPVGQGTGLGLSISYGIVHEHGGRIELQSEPGQGATFVVHLPVEPDESNDDGLNLENAVAAARDAASPPAASIASGTPPRAIPAAPANQFGESAP